MDHNSGLEYRDKNIHIYIYIYEKFDPWGGAKLHAMLPAIANRAHKPVETIANHMQGLSGCLVSDLCLLGATCMIAYTYTAVCIYVYV